MFRLKEQLLATEKIVNANKTLLKKLQEQVGGTRYSVWCLSCLGVLSHLSCLMRTD